MLYSLIRSAACSNNDLPSNNVRAREHNLEVFGVALRADAPINYPACHPWRKPLLVNATLIRPVSSWSESRDTRHEE